MQSGMSVSPLRVGTLQRLMADHRYFSDWTVDQIRAVESQVHIVNAQPGTEIAHLLFARAQAGFSQACGGSVVTAVEPPGAG